MLWRNIIPGAAAFALLAAAAPAVAQEALAAPQWGAVGYGGTGCPDGTAEILMSPDGQGASLVLTDYAVGEGSRPVERKTCAVAIPVAVPDGMAVAVRAVAVRGAAELPEGVEATLTVEPFLAGAVGTPVETSVSGPGTATLFSLPFVAADDLDWSACGADVNLRVNTSLRTRGNAGARAEVRAINLFSLATKAC
jgi:hypothetical protein